MTSSQESEGLVRFFRLALGLRKQHRDARRIKGAFLRTRGEAEADDG